MDREVFKRARLFRHSHSNQQRPVGRVRIQPQETWCRLLCPASVRRGRPATQFARQTHGSL